MKKLLFFIHEMPQAWQYEGGKDSLKTNLASSIAYIQRRDFSSLFLSLISYVTWRWSVYLVWLHKTSFKAKIRFISLHITCFNANFFQFQKQHVEFYRRLTLSRGKRVNQINHFHSLKILRVMLWARREKNCYESTF